MSTIGNASAPTSEDGTGAYTLGISFTMPAGGGVLTKLSMYCRNSLAANNVVISLFGDNGSNQPDLANKLADTGSLAETVGGAANGTLTEGAASATLVAGTKYWIVGGNTSAAGDHDNHKMGLTSGGSFLYRSGNGIPTGTWATGDFGTHSGDTPTMYATYTPGGGGGGVTPVPPTQRGRTTRRHRDESRRPRRANETHRRRALIARAPVKWPTIYTVTMAGGLSSGGAAVSSLKRAIIGAGGLASSGAAPSSEKFVPSPSGGLNSGGAAPTSFNPGGATPRRTIYVAHRRGRLHRADPARQLVERHRLIIQSTVGSPSSGTTYTYTMSGGLSSSGHAPASIRYVPGPAGGLQSGGHAPMVQRKVIIASGGLQSGGAALARILRAVLASGGLQSGGSTPVRIVYVPRPSGGLNAGGAAGITFQGVYVFAASGGLQSSGASPVWRRFVPALPIGGLVAGGTVPAAKRYGWFANGGLVASGIATVRATRALVAAGGLASGGAATSIYIFGGTIPAAFSGRVLVYPRFDGRVLIDPD